MKKQEVILHTGGNLGDRANNLRLAARHIAQRIGPVVRTSGIYQTQAWGVTDQPDFLNQALVVETNLSAHRVLDEVLEIEKMMGRVRSDKWTARLIDIDLLFYGEEIINTPELIIPHPFLHMRNFVLAPLAEIAPDKWHPILNASVVRLYSLSPDTLKAFPLQHQTIG